MQLIRIINLPSIKYWLYSKRSCFKISRKCHQYINMQMHKQMDKLMEQELEQLNNKFYIIKNDEVCNERKRDRDNNLISFKSKNISFILHCETLRIGCYTK